MTDLPYVEDRLYPYYIKKEAYRDYCKGHPSNIEVFEKMSVKGNTKFYGHYYFLVPESKLGLLNLFPKGLVKPCCWNQIRFLSKIWKF